MIKLIATAFIVLAALQVSRAVDPKYPVSDIPEELKKNVNAVVREDKMIYTILSRSQGKCYNYFAVTILNPNGKKFAERDLFYDKLTKISDLEANVYDAFGKLVKKLKKNEISDESAFDGVSLFSDNRVKSIDLKQGFYPYTVEFEYTVVYDFLYSIDGSVIVPGENVSVQHASYQLVFPNNLRPRYKTLNITHEPTSGKTSDGLEFLSWDFNSLTAIKYEPFAPSRSFLPQIIAAPTAFEFAGYVGDMSTWEKYGQWIQLLNRNRDVIPPATKAKVAQLTKDLRSTEEKVKVLYEFLQSKTRYVSISLGIGGLQPFEASVVDEMSYGDCKALSNYMVTLLKEVGIKGYYTTVYAGSNPPKIMLDLPSHQDNHVIVAVPNEADTIWLECTSQTNPFGYMGKFTGDRHALMITESGGKIVRTPRYSAEKNVQSTSADVVIETTGDATANVKTVYSGIQYETDDLDNAIRNFETQKKWLQNNIKIPTFDIVDFTMTEHKNKLPSIDINVNLSLKKLAPVSGKRIFLTPNLMNRNSFIPEKIENRKTNIVLSSDFTDSDTIRYHVPEGIYPEFLPEPTKIKTRFGEYESNYKIDNGLIIYTRKFQMRRGEFPPDAYGELVDFFKNITKADNTKIVFLSKT